MHISSETNVYVFSLPEFLLTKENNKCNFIELFMMELFRMKDAREMLQI